MNGDRGDFVKRMFSKSVTKQAKYDQIVTMLGRTDGQTCLDLGGDNGVISLLLRERGGTWYSADLSPEAVASIESVVGDRVFLVDGDRTPFDDAQFDRIVVVDLLEHVTTDREFVTDLRRVIRDDGVLIVNVPHVKPQSILNRVRHAIGQTDERHGHVRPGYSIDTLGRTLSPWFTIREVKTYSRTFSELVDTAMRFAVDLVKGHRTGSDDQPHKGNIVTQNDLEKSGGGFGLFSLTYPFVWVFSRLDHLLFLQKGYKLIVRAEVNEANAPGEGHP
jgi:ubiquinone/menaquinone biosynthesis C-methylase UbiE